MAKDDLLQKNVQDLIDIIDGKKPEGDDGTPSKTTKLQDAASAFQKLNEARIKNEDITLLIEILTIAAILLAVYVIYPYFTADKSFIFSKEQLMDAMKMPSTAFSVEEVAKVQQELDALAAYFKYFSDTGTPYSFKAQGLEDLGRGVVFLPIIAFVVTFVIPPFVSLYLIWFIVKYWKSVIEATWGWFVMMYEYGTKLIEGKLGCKWYISMVTGWGCHSPKFSQYYDDWLKKFVIVPSYHEKLAYVDKYTTTKNKWYTLPKLKYFDTPKGEVETELKYSKKLAIDRTGETFLKTLAGFEETLYDNPRDELYKWMLKDPRSKEISDKTSPSSPSSGSKFLKYFMIIVLVIGILSIGIEVLNPSGLSGVFSLVSSLFSKRK